MGCGCNNCGGLGEGPTVPDYVVAGSVIEWGGHLRQGVNGVAWSIEDSDLQNVLEGCLYQTGGFSDVQATQVAGSITPYLGVRVTVANDFSHLVDVFNLITGQMANCAGMVVDTKAFWILSVPPAAAGNQQVAQAGTGGNVNQQVVQKGWQWPSLSLPSLSTDAGLSSNPIDALASFLGVTPTMAAVIGAGLAVVAVVAVKKIL